MSLFLTSWSRAWKGLLAAGDGRLSMELLLQKYAESPRKYHTLQHLGECLSLFDELSDQAEHPAEVEMALWFHDAIYELKRHDNEEQSAALARTVLTAAAVAPASIQRIEDLILATRHTALPVSPDKQLLVDIDLAILGADTLRFAEYEKQIRDEYSFVPKWIFNHKRSAILQTFLARERIYSTDVMFAKREAEARINLRAAIGA